MRCTRLDFGFRKAATPGAATGCARRSAPFCATGGLPSWAVLDRILRTARQLKSVTEASTPQCPRFADPEKPDGDILSGINPTNFRLLAGIIAGLVGRGGGQRGAGAGIGRRALGCARRQPCSWAGGCAGPRPRRAMGHVGWRDDRRCIVGGERPPTRAAYRAPYGSHRARTESAPPHRRAHRQGHRLACASRAASFAAGVPM